jgi:hypothetical protein
MANKTKDATLQSTKQMLDELDALMDKMLSLPMNETEDSSVSAPEIKPPSLSPMLSATLTLLEPPSKAPVRDLPSSEPLPHPAVNPPHVEMPVAPPPMREPAPLPEPMTNDVAPPSVMPKLEPLLEQVSEPDVPLETQWVYLPLLWMNQAFDAASHGLGGGGAWLRTQAGRMLLGMSGIALMAFAIAWLLRDWMGWN